MSKPLPTTHHKKTSTSLVNDYHLLTYDTVDSTNEEAIRLALGGASHGAFIWAKEQTNGRGREDRQWISLEGNLFVSVLLAPQIELARLPELSFVASIAMMDAIAPLLPLSAKLECKWPNDIMLNGKKLGGILCESFEEKGKRWVTVGLGVNVESSPRRNVNFPAISLQEAGVEIVSAKIVLSRFIHHFIARYNEWKRDGFAPIRAQWVHRCWMYSKTIRVAQGNKILSGLCKGIDRKGALVLLTRAGKMHVISAGEILPPGAAK